MKLIILAIISSITYVFNLPIITGATTNSTYLLSCGAPSTVNTAPSALDGRIWKSDTTDFTFSNNSLSATAVPSTGSNSAPQIPFSTARIFTSNFTYSFLVSPGPKLVRLFFNPADYSSSPSITFPASDAYLTVQSSSGHTFLRNFSAYAANPSSAYFNKEFYVPVTDSHLNLTFLPTLPSSYAFLNGIEIVSVPENLYVKSLDPQPTYVPNSASTFVLDNFTALEVAYRLNVGGSDISPAGDSGNMYRQWVRDDPFVIGNFAGQTGIQDQTGVIIIEYTQETPNYTAPVDVYNTMRWVGAFNKSNSDWMKYNVSWNFKVDLGFNYLVRLHWCEIASHVKSSEYRVFDVYLNEMVADRDVDIYGSTGGRDIPTYRDYVVPMDGKDGQGFLLLELHPSTDMPYYGNDILLNGAEIFKINRTDGSLDTTNPDRPPPQIRPTPSQQQKTTSHIVPIIIGAVTGSTVVVALLLYILLFTNRRKQSKTFTNSSGSSKSKFLLFSFGKSSSSSNNTTKRSGSTLPSHLCRRYTLSELKLATSDFTPSLIIGHGGFGNVYKATLPTDSNPTTPVAIKRLNPLSGQGAREFTTEIELLSKLRHLHLVSLIGYCDDSSEMILVYEFMSHGTLRDHLYPNPNPPLPWTRRLKICIDSARGLHYLHTGTHRMIIHRDVKSTNILLDHNFVAKVSDFGLSKFGPIGGDSTHVSTAVKGSFGYVDPEYYRRQQLTEKSDVYSFGVVLFEVLCGRAAVNPALPKEQVNLRIWGRRNWASETLDTIVDPNLKGQIGEECLRKFGEVAESCVREDGASRPSMVDVIWGLEFALQLQMEAGGMMMSGDLDSVGGVDFFSTNNGNSPSAGAAARLILSSDENLWASSVNHSSSGLFTSSGTADRLGGSTDVFSQIFNPEGR